MAKGRTSRKIVTSNAARAVVKSLTRQGIDCILVSDIAAQFLWNGKAPPAKIIEVVVMSRSKGTISKGYAEALLISENPAAFRVRLAKNTGTTVFSYFDSIIQPPKKSWCDVILINVNNPPPPEYAAENVTTVDGLPVCSMFLFVVDKLRLFFSGITNKDQQPSRLTRKRFEKGIVKHFPSMVWPHGLEPLRQEALLYLEQALLVFPELSPEISRCILDSQKASGYGINPPLSSTRLSTGPLDIIAEVQDVEINHPQVKIIDIPTESKHQHALALTTDRKPNRVHFRTEVLCLIAKRVVDFVRQAGVECAIFGSLACYLYGNTRPPNDIDLLAFPRYEGTVMDAEKLKRDIAAHDPVHFRLETPKDPTATYRVLYFFIDQGLAPNKTFPKNRCKVDVLVPGILHLPFLTGNNIKWHGGLPVVPFPVLLLQKLQGWDDHIHMKEEYKFEKHETDAADIQALLKLEHVVSLRFSQPWDNVTLLSREFMELSRERITDFCIFYRESAVDWSLLGFDIHYYAESL